MIFSIFAFAMIQLSVEEAYKAIPHSRTIFDPVQFSGEPAAKNDLIALFQICDEAIVIKVEGIRAAAKNEIPFLTSSLQAYDRLLDRLKNLEAKKSIQDAARLISSAISDHRQYFFNLQKSGSYNGGAWPPEIHSASQKLQRAYSVLMEKFPKQSERNQKAFYDYLCALDFL